MACLCHQKSTHHTTKTRRITWSIPVTKVFLLSIAWICIVKSRAEIGFLVMAATSSWQIKIRNLNRSCNCWKCHLSFGKSMQLVRKEPRSKAYEGWHQAELLGGLHKSASMFISLSICIHGMWGHCGTLQIHDNVEIEFCHLVTREPWSLPCHHFLCVASIPQCRTVGKHTSFWCVLADWFISWINESRSYRLKRPRFSNFHIARFDPLLSIHITSWW